MNTLVAAQDVGRKIFLIRGKRVMLDSDLAQIYGVTTARLNQQVRRNQRRFPDDFMFVLAKAEYANLMLQSATSSPAYGGRRKLPSVFTEHGAVMLAAVLRTPVAIEASLFIARTFVRLREVLAANKGLAGRLETIERRLAGHDADLGRQNKQLRAVFRALRRLMNSPVRPRPRIGFQPPAA
ncbi:MAG: ORF6N domain-containing protein [Elusimicrobia bacterium]|nr:ORF6N domain-containing protein [Elusimicrobiota bacterium]